MTRSLVACWSLFVMGVSVLGLLGGLASGEVHAADAAGPSHHTEVPSYNRDVRPILSDKCFFCHGPDAADRKGDLRLDVEEDAKALRDGMRAIDVKEVEKSAILQRILTDDEDDLMPPASSHKSVSPEEVEVLRKWIAGGAPWEEHWAFAPFAAAENNFAEDKKVKAKAPPASPASPAPPGLSQGETPQVLRDRIDHWVGQGLEEKGWKAAQQADDSTLLRRLSFDITGLPPTEEKMNRWLGKDGLPVEEVVDVLLGEEAYAERMAFEWMKIARYADTHGYQKDNYRSMWAWRDWVIQAYHDNQPFDAFTVEQLAGDLLPNPTVHQRVATGFHRNHRINAEAGIVEEEYHAEYVMDRVDTTGTVWMGLTLACARCHDHKYDPISQKEYFQLFAFFNQVEEKGRDGVAQAAAPWLELPVLSAQAGLQAAEKKREQAQEELEKVVGQQGAAMKQWQLKVEEQVKQRRFTASAMPVESCSKGGSKMELASDWEDRSVRVRGGNPLNDVHEFRFALAEGRYAGLQVQALSDEAHAHGRLARSFTGNFLMSGVEVVWQKEGQEEVLELSASATSEMQGREVSGLLDQDIRTGWSPDLEASAEGACLQLDFKKPLQVKRGEQLLLRLRYESREEQFIAGRVRFNLLADQADRGDWNGREQELPMELVLWLEQDAEEKSARRDELRGFFRDMSPLFVAEREALKQARGDWMQAKEASTTQVMVMEERKEKRDAFVLLRGEYDKKGEKVEAAVPSALAELRSDRFNRLGGFRGLGDRNQLAKQEVKQGAKKSLNRLDLAEWLVEENRALTARVHVNRLWAMVFGRGLVKSLEDFGLQGEWPTHPELLEELALAFVQSGWDQKAFLKEILLSKTYQQASSAVGARGSLWQEDPENKWLGRGARRRLSAPMLRDQALALSGLLVSQVGGPSVKPFQPAGLWESVAGVNSNTTRYQADAGDALWRRSLYTFWKRSVAPPSMSLFDVPTREVCMVGESRTNTPLQALAMMNDPTYMEASKKLASEVLQWKGSKEEKLERLWRKFYGKKAGAEVVAILKQAWQTHLQEYQEDEQAALKLLGAQWPKDLLKSEGAAQSAAAVMVMSALYNLDQSLTRE